MKEPVNLLKPGEGHDFTDSGTNMSVLCCPIAPQARQPINTNKNQNSYKGLHLNNRDIMPSPKRDRVTLLPQSAAYLLVCVTISSHTSSVKNREKKSKVDMELSTGNVGPGSPPLNG